MGIGREGKAVGLTPWLVTVGAVGLYVLGGHVPLPGVETPPTLGGDAGHSLSLFALGVAPIISGLVVMEVARLAIPPLARWAAKGQRQTQSYIRVARALALAFAAFQALGVAATLEGVDFVVDDPGWAFRIEIAAILVGATASLMWLIDMINSQGVGDGLVVLFAAPFVVRFPIELVILVQKARIGTVGAYAPIGLLALAVAGVTALVATTRRGTAGAALDLWSPLLGGLIFQAAVVVVAVVGFAAAGHGPFVARVMGIDETGGFAVALAASIAVVALRRAKVDEAAGTAIAWPQLGVEIVICCVGLLIGQTLRILDAASGFVLILCVAAALSLLPPWRGGRALAPG